MNFPAEIEGCEKIYIFFIMPVRRRAHLKIITSVIYTARITDSALERARFVVKQDYFRKLTYI